jgi:DNA invertase Pin-like site-specific DNA recombinase
MPRTTASTATAYSYIRFSSPQQAKGDSLRRQQELRDAWVKKAGAVLDTSLTLRDEGVSAYSGGHRQNPDRHALAAFLELVKRRRIQRGSYLVVESLDRLSREHIRPALTLLLNLIEAGVRIVQLLPVEAVYDEHVEPMALMQAIMELSRGHSESRMKSERVGGAWKQKKKAAATDKAPITRRVPSWLRVVGGRFVVDEEKAAAVRRIYRMAAEGFGIGAIVKRLNAEHAPAIGNGKNATEYWARSYIAKILGTRATMGEYQPHTRRGGIARHPEGKPITGYFPAVVSEDEWHAARAALVSRRNKGGRPTPRVNLFANLLRDARDGASLHVVDKGKKKGGGPSLVNYKAVMGVQGASYVSFPLHVFEQAILSRLQEIKPRDVLPEGDGAADKVLALTGKLADAEGRIEKLKAQLIEGDDLAPLVDVLRTLEEKRVNLADELAAAKREAASPLAATWGEYRSLLDALAKAPDPADARVRLRASLRRIVESVWCLFVTTAPSESTERKRPEGVKSAGRGAVRIAAVQIRFTGGAHRDYVILHRPPCTLAMARRPAQTLVRSFAEAGADDDGLDLRNRKHAEALAKKLEEWELR